MIIVFISHSGRIGGAERSLLETIEALNDQGMDCRVLLPEHGELSDELKSLYVPFSIIPYGLWVSRGKQNLRVRLAAVARHLMTIPMILWKIKKWKCDIVYSNTITVCVGAIAAAIIHRPHVWHIREFGYEDHGLVFMFGERLSLRILNDFSSACIFISRSLATKYSNHIEPEKIKIIYNSMHRARNMWTRIDKQPSKVPSRTCSFRCIILGSVVEGKGQEEAVKAIFELVTSNVSIELLIVGHDYFGYGQRLKEFVTQHGLQKHLVFLGNLDNPFPVIESSDAVLVCSRAEAFGRVTVEAMLAGKPVIGARSGATPELIEDGCNGLLYTLGDPKSLASKVLYLYENPDVCKRIGADGKKWAEAIFNRERYSSEISGLLTSIVTTSSSRTK
jgi:glycosyltransferase involved in cell wall biosynthesis